MNLKSYATHAFTGPLLVYAFEELSVAASAVPLTAATLAVTGKQKGVRVFCTIAGADIRYRLDGTAPDASTGHIVYDQGTLEVEGIENLQNLQMIAVSGTAKVSVSYSRYEG